MVKKLWFYLERSRASREVCAIEYQLYIHWCMCTFEFSTKNEMIFKLKDVERTKHASGKTLQKSTSSFFLSFFVYLFQSDKFRRNSKIWFSLNRVSWVIMILLVRNNCFWVRKLKKRLKTWDHVEKLVLSLFDLHFYNLKRLFYI